MSYQGRQGVLIRDFLGVLKDPVFIQGAGLMVLSLMDGRRSLKDIQLELIRQKEGSFISLESVNKVVSEFDAAFLLDSAEYRKKRDQITAGYLAEETREAVLAGTAYPASPEELSAYVESILSENDGERSQSNFSDVRALIAPHIDIKTGRVVYAAAYREVRGLTPKKILVLGVGHHLQDGFVSLTEKDYLTPLGRVKTDKIWVKRLKEIGKEVAAPHDITHKMEHSIEFQLLFLQSLFGQDFMLIPILCGSFSDVLYSASRPSEILGMKGFLEGLREFLREDPGTLVVA
ncbi:MAG: AmmeMemoRadiSam system protein B, partial [Candidatus Aminicenantes bacterium]|nr:AmmeMemoRadiSam system protein B [Candidatus Aminicenantes bacterium]